MWGVHLYLDDESEFSTSSLEGAMTVVSFELFLKSSCSCKKTNPICQDAGLLMTVRITKDTGLWKIKRKESLSKF